MARRKKWKFGQVEGFRNVVEPSKSIFREIKGEWKGFFGNSNPIVLELACGYGEYTVGLARLFPDCNFIGVDIKGDRIWKGAVEAINEDLQNVAFLRTSIENLGNFFEKSEVAGIWLTFPDPQPNKESRRLTSPRHLQIYQNISQDQANFYLKTDNTNFFNYSLDQLLGFGAKDLKYTFDLDNSPYSQQAFGLVTRYQSQFKDSKVKFLSCLL